MKFSILLCLAFSHLLLIVPARAAVVSATQHGVGVGDFDAMISTTDLIAGQLGTELAPLYGWHPANTDPADQMAALTDGAGILGSGLTGLLDDFPAAGTPAKTVRYSFPSSDISSFQILTGNNGADGRIFSTTVIRYSVNNGGSFNYLGYFQSDPSGTLNLNTYRSTMVRIYDDSSPLLLSGVTDVIFELYAVDNSLGQMRDPFDGVNPYTGADDGLTAPITSPLVLELDVVAVPEPSTLCLLGLGVLLLRKLPSRRAG